MLNSRIFKKFIISILIITLTFSNWAILGQYAITYAAQEIDLKELEEQMNNNVDENEEKEEVENTDRKPEQPENTNENISEKESDEEPEIIETKTEATLTIDSNKLSSMRVNENVELRIELHNNKNTSDLYVNPSFEIEFPKEITKLEINEWSVFFDEELVITNIQEIKRDGKIVLAIQLFGEQTELLLEEYINGTTVVVNVDLEIDAKTPSKTETVIMKYR